MCPNDGSGRAAIVRHPSASVVVQPVLDVLRVARTVTFDERIGRID